MPKFNMYQSLHTTVIGPQGKPVELQIRTHDMHRTAEYGIAAHWKYKEKARAGGKPSAGEFGAPKVGSPDDMLWLRQLLDWQREAQEPGEFLETLRYDLGPAGGLRLHAQGRRHQPARRVDAGRLRLRGAHRGRPPHHRRPGQRPAGLAGQQAGQRRRRRGLHLEVADAPARPRTGWPSSARSRARTKIRQWFTKERREDAVEAGKEALTRAMRKAGLPLQRLLGGEALVTLARTCATPTSPRSTRRWGRATSRATSVVEKLITALGGSEGAVEDIAETAIPARTGAAPARPATPASWSRACPDVWAKLAKCCTPVPGDDILGFVTRGGGVSRAPHATAPTPATSRASRSGWSRWSGRRPPARCSWSRSRSRRWTGTGCSPTSPRCCPTSG